MITEEGMSVTSKLGDLEYAQKKCCYSNPFMELSACSVLDPDLMAALLSSGHLLDRSSQKSILPSAAAVENGQLACRIAQAGWCSHRERNGRVSLEEVESNLLSLLIKSSQYFE